MSAMGQPTTNTEAPLGCVCNQDRFARECASTLEEVAMSADVVVPSPVSSRTPWNKGRLVGQKRALRPRDVWSIRIRLEIGGATRDPALFNLAINSKLRACDLVRLRVDDVWIGGHARERATIVQKKTGRPVQFEITEPTRAALKSWLEASARRSGQYLFPSRRHSYPHMSTRQYQLDNVPAFRTQVRFQ